MKLYVIRHGEAMPAQALQGDAIRPLTPFGEQEVMVNAQWLAHYLEAQQHPSLDLLLVSPFVRARQTASVLTSVVATKTEQVSNEITPEGNAELFADWLFAELQRLGSQVKQVAIVSHMPFVSFLVAALDRAATPMMFPTAGIAELTLQPEDWRGQFERMAVAEPPQ